MSFRPLVLAAALATTLPGAASAFTMICDDANGLRSARYASGLGRDFPAYRRPGLPEWVKERRSQRFERRAPRTNPITPRGLPEWVRERRENIGRRQRPELPDWVRERRNARPALRTAFGGPGDGRATAVVPPRPAPAVEAGAVPVLHQAPGANPIPVWGGPRFVGPARHPGWGG